MNAGGDLDCMIDNMPLGYALDTGPGAKQHTLLDSFAKLISGNPLRQRHIQFFSAPRYRRSWGRTRTVLYCPSLGKKHTRSSIDSHW